MKPTGPLSFSREHRLPSFYVKYITISLLASQGREDWMAQKHSLYGHFSWLSPNPKLAGGCRRAGCGKHLPSGAHGPAGGELLTPSPAPGRSFPAIYGGHQEGFHDRGWGGDERGGRWLGPGGVKRTLRARSRTRGGSE